jgi:hypothetical protein
MWGVTDTSFYWMTIGEIDELQQALTENHDQPEIRRRLDTLYASTNLYATLDTGFYSLLMFFACAGALFAAEKFNESKAQPQIPAAGREKHGFPDSMAAQPALKANILLTWVLLGYASAHLFIEIQPRYRYFAMPAICMLAALGFLRIWHRIWRRAA